MLGEITRYVIQRGDTLRSIAYAFYKDEDRWPVIFRYNKHLINDPNVCDPGLSIVIPHVMPNACL